MAVVTISRQFGAGGRTFGEGLAKRLKYRYVHEDMIKEIAIKAEVSHQTIQDFERRGSTKLMKFLDKIKNTPFVPRLLSEDYEYVDEDMVVDAVRKVILELYEEGNVVIIGRGSQYVLRGYKDAWHILLVGEMKDRVRFLMDHYYLKENEAEKAVTRADEIRKRFLNFFAAEKGHDDPMNYHLCLNMSQLTMEQAESLALKLISNISS